MESLKKHINERGNFANKYIKALSILALFTILNTSVESSNSLQAQSQPKLKHWNNHGLTEFSDFECPFCRDLDRSREDRSTETKNKFDIQWPIAETPEKYENLYKEYSKIKKFVDLHNKMIAINNNIESIVSWIIEWGAILERQYYDEEILKLTNELNERIIVYNKLIQSSDWKPGEWLLTKNQEIQKEILSLVEDWSLLIAKETTDKQGLNALSWSLEISSMLLELIDKDSHDVYQKYILEACLGNGLMDMWILDKANNFLKSYSVSAEQIFDDIIEINIFEFHVDIKRETLALPPKPIKWYEEKELKEVVQETILETKPNKFDLEKSIEAKKIIKWDITRMSNGQVTIWEWESAFVIGPKYYGAYGMYLMFKRNEANSYKGWNKRVLPNNESEYTNLTRNFFHHFVYGDPNSIYPEQNINTYEELVEFKDKNWL